jgi:hypothetical protein
VANTLAYYVTGLITDIKKFYNTNPNPSLIWGLRLNKVNQNEDKMSPCHRDLAWRATG